MMDKSMNYGLEGGVTTWCLARRKRGETITAMPRFLAHPRGNYCAE